MVVREVGQLEARQLPGTDRGLAPFFSADGEWIGFLRQGGRDLLKVAVRGGPPIQLAKVDGINGAVWTPDGMIVASIRDRLLIVPEAGGTLEPLIPRDTASGEAGQRNPRLLADGKTMLYFSWRNNFVESRIGVLSLATRTVRYVDLRGATPIGVLEGHLIYANATGSIMAVPFDLARVRLLGTPLPVIDEVDVGGSGSVRAALSHSGSLLYALGSPSTQIVRVDAKGTVSVLVAEPRNYAGPRFSPDGKRLAFSIASNVDMHVWIYDIASSTLTRLTNDGTSNSRAEWTPDGKKVLYLSNRGGRNELWWQNADFSGAAELVEGSPDGNLSAGVFAPHDGRILAFWGSSPRHPVDIQYRNLNGDTTRKPIAATTAGEISPKFSRDGKWIAYASNQDGALQIYVQPFPPTGVRHKLTAVGGMTPVWSHDGKRIYYALGDRLRVATIRTTPDFAVTARDSLLSGNYIVTVPPHANYDISRDGDFVLLRPVDTGEGLVVVHDWKYELRERTRLARRP